jgi:xanthine/CO dehydrogenase XdhC/CoxF family maturation factor
VKELGDILSALPTLRGPAVLATIVAVEGSTYRRPGARMLISPELPGGRIGSISGGCLEDEACRRALFLTADGPAVVTYETGLDDGAGTPSTLGCGGRVTVLFERVGPGLTPPYLEVANRGREAGKAVLVATVVAAEAASGFRLADRPLLLAEGEALPETGELAAEAAAALAELRTRFATVESNGARADILLEVIPAPIHLFLFGSGHDALPVGRLAASLGWKVTIVAQYADAAVQARFPGTDVIELGRHSLAAAGRRTAAIVMNHHYARDVEAVGLLLRSRAAYIGILGPRHRTDAMLSDVASSREFDAAAMASRMDMSRIHAPIGLDIGAETAEEVALAIVAEVQAFFAERDGGRLRERNGAIHPQVRAPVAAAVVRAACPLDEQP